MGMQFAHVEYSISTRSLDLFVTGCYGSCQNCCNPEIKSFSLKGFEPSVVLTKVMQLDTKFGNLIDKVILVGGDFYDNYITYKDEMTDFLKRLKQITPKPLFLFTRHELDEIPRELLELVDYVKTGAYIPELTCDDNIQEGIKLATSNQRIYKVADILEKVC